jgi:hypothetical protein
VCTRCPLLLLDLICWKRGAFYLSKKLDCVHKVCIVATACIILQHNQNIAETFHSKFMFLNVFRSKIAIITVSVVLTIRDGETCSFRILLWVKFNTELLVVIIEKFT